METWAQRNKVSYPRSHSQGFPTWLRACPGITCGLTQITCGDLWGHRAEALHAVPFPRARALTLPGSARVVRMALPGRALWAPKGQFHLCLVFTASSSIYSRLYLELREGQPHPPPPRDPLAPLPADIKSGEQGAWEGLYSKHHTIQEDCRVSLNMSTESFKGGPLTSRILQHLVEEMLA